MTLIVHRQARLLSSLQGDDPATLDVSLPGLPLGTTLDPEVLHGAACGENDLELFYPEPGDQAAKQAAKAICAACPVKDACLEMALAIGDQHAILGGTTPAERVPMRCCQCQQIHAREQAAEWATAATGIDPGELRAPAGRSMAAHLRGDASATVRAWELCKSAGTAHVAALIGVHVTDLHAALAHWGLEVPNLHQPAQILEDPVRPGRRSGWCSRSAGSRPPARWEWPGGRCERHSDGGGWVSPSTAARAPRRGWWWIGRWPRRRSSSRSRSAWTRRPSGSGSTGRPCTTPGSVGGWGDRLTVRTASGWRVNGAWRPRSSRTPITPGGPTARSGSRGGHLSGQSSGRLDPSAERCPLFERPSGRPTWALTMSGLGRRPNGAG
jgi:WhiB family transcriptional regulator, redox-sensing transcriptional regulator